jgi:hypothetical protein
MLLARLGTGIQQTRTHTNATSIHPSTHLYNHFPTDLCIKLHGPKSFKCQHFTSSSTKFPQFYETPMFITVFTTARHLSLSLAQTKAGHTLPSYVSNTHFNIILRPRPFFKLVSFPASTIYEFPPPSLPAPCPAHLINRTVTRAQYKP